MPVGFDKAIIFNMALSLTGSKSTVENVDENTRPAGIMRTWYDHARLGTLEDYNWNFAKKRLKLSTHEVAAPTNEWAFRYQWPADAVAARYIENPNGPTADAVPYEIEQGDDDTMSIVTDMEEATLVYTKNVDSPTLFSTAFIEMLATKLAWFAVIELNGKPQRKQSLANDYNAMLFSLPARDARQNTPREERDASWVRDR